MPLRDWFRPPRHVLAIFLAVALISAGALGWLGWLLLEQDQAVETQRRQERLEEAADRAVAVVERALAGLESQLGRATAAAIPGVSLVAIAANGTVARAEPGLLYCPLPAAEPEAPPEVFAEAERLEFARNGPAAAAATYQRLADAAEPAVRAGALTRLARVHRRLHDPAAAARAYDRLAQIAHAGVAGLPAGLIARAGRASLFEETHRIADLHLEAAALQNDLRDGRWQLTRQQYELYASQAATWLGKARDEDPDAVARAEAFDWLWQNRQAAEPAAQRLVQAQRLIEVNRSPALVLWSRAPDRLYAAVAGPQYIDALCREAVPGSTFRWAITNLEGRTVVGQAPPAREVAVRTAAATRMPWTLHLFAPAPSPGSPLGPSPRRQLLLWVFAVLAIVLSTGAYFILRAISREMRVARLQSDFVAAVSHEFRSPLSSLSQIAEMLVRDRFPSEDLRRKSYDVLERETERLRRLVEGLLDFGRFEAGASAYRFEVLEAVALLRDVIAEFQERVAPQGYAIELSAPEDPLYVRADREALSRALWNLLDNAVKYSPECHTVWVEVEAVSVSGHQANRISIAVRDRGLGIPTHEQGEIFNRFVRGAESKARRIKGTGIGLAMVRHIVQVHGGEIRLASEPGQGSRFTVVLRASGDAA